MNELLRAGEVADVRVRVGLKETADPVPVCYCFGFTERMLLEEIGATGDTTIPQRIAAEMKAGHCACETRNPQGFVLPRQRQSCHEAGATKITTGRRRRYANKNALLS